MLFDRLQDDVLLFRSLLVGRVEHLLLDLGVNRQVLENLTDGLEVFLLLVGLEKLLHLAVLALEQLNRVHVALLRLSNPHEKHRSMALRRRPTGNRRRTARPETGRAAWGNALTASLGR